MVNDSQDSLVPATEVAISAAFLCVVNIGIIIGNFLVLIVVWRTSKLHEPNYFFLCNLSVADLLVGLIYCPLLIASVIKQSWVFGDPLCRAHSVIVSASLNASLMNLCAISVDRYFFITRPLRYTEIVTSRKTSIAIAFVWLHSIFWAIAPCSVGVNGYTKRVLPPASQIGMEKDWRTDRTLFLWDLFVFFFPFLLWSLHIQWSTKLRGSSCRTCRFLVWLKNNPREGTNQQKLFL